MRRTLCRPGGDPRPPAALAAYEPGSTAQASVIFLGGMLHAPISELSSLEFYPPRPGATSTREETCPFRCPSSNGARCRCPPVTRSVTIHPYDRYQRSGCRHGLVGLPAGPAATARIGPSGDEIFRGADHMVPHRGHGRVGVAGLDGLDDGTVPPDVHIADCFVQPGHMIDIRIELSGDGQESSMKSGTTASMSYTAEIPAVPCTAITPTAGNATH